jgi:formylglycine-generating enzyme required for sulfatase activity
MKKNNILIIIIIILFQSCTDEVVEKKDEMEIIPEEITFEYPVPKLIYIKKDLIFTMGNIWDDPVNNSEVPAHKVKLSPYYIGKFEVTNDEYFNFVKVGGYLDSSLWSTEGWKLIKKNRMVRPLHWDSSDAPWKNYSPSNEPDKPVSNIYWFEAEAYCNWLNRKTNQNFHLPTEAQWERAAKGPDPGKKYPWGDINDITKYNEYGMGLNNNVLTKVGAYENGKSDDGCYDMSGNVMEFCFDWLDDNSSSYYQICFNLGVVNNPEGPKNGTSKVLRGMNCGYSSSSERSRQIRTTTRSSVMMDSPLYFYGFRVALNYK